MYIKYLLIDANDCNFSILPIISNALDINENDEYKLSQFNSEILHIRIKTEIRDKLIFLVFFIPLMAI